MIHHEKGFTIVDYSSIEARVLQWVAGDEEALQVFRDGTDPYKWMATKIYGVPYDQVTQPQRFCGKQSILGLGYQMSYKTFVSMVESYGETIAVEEAKLAVDVYRKVHRKVVRLWSNMQAGAVMALQRPGKSIKVNRYVQYVLKGNFLHMVLPSGRSIKYYQPKIEESYGKLTVSYMGVNDKHQYVRIKSYGGKFTENGIQGISRDILAEAITRLLDAEFSVVTHVHDEVVVLGQHSVSIIGGILCELPTWAEGLPLESEGFNAYRFKKG